MAHPPFSGFVEKSTDPKAVKILFIGNSITYFQSMYYVFDSLASRSARPKTVSVAYVMGSSYFLQNHWNAGVAYDFISNKGPWDYVILQEHSEAQTNYPQSMNYYLTAFVNAIKWAKSTPILFETYEERGADEATRSRSVRTLRLIANQHGMRILPVAEVWNTVLQEGEVPLYFGKTGNHPTIQGNYLFVCTLYSLLFHESPANLPTIYEYASHGHRASVNLVEQDRQRELIQDAVEKVVPTRDSGSNSR